MARLKYVISIGYFDGLHLGHQALLKSLVRLAFKNGAKPLVITFGDDFFYSLGLDIKIIDLEKEKINKIKKFGIMNVDLIKPANSFLKMSGNEFENYIMTKYDLCGICIGEDFTYGHFAASGIKELEKLSKKNKIFLHVEKLTNVENKKVSSTLLRNLLKEGNVNEYELYAGCKYTINGRVIHGRSDGSKYGFKTANIDYNPLKMIPGNGVYITETNVEGKRYRSLTHIGECPTFENKEITIETMLLNFSKVIYEKNIEITFLKKIRENIKFITPAELRKQIDKDVERIKELYD